MNCHSDPELAEGEESPHFARSAIHYTIAESALYHFSCWYRAETLKSSFWRSQNLSILFVAPLHLQEISSKTSIHYATLLPAECRVLLFKPGECVLKML
jgi:hypothetical protein